MKRVDYHRLAASEFVEASAYYERRCPLLGDRFVAAVDVARDLVREKPARGRPEKFGMRSFKVRRFPYRLFYEDQADRIWIVAVAHLSRRPGYWVRRRI